MTAVNPPETEASAPGLNVIRDMQDSGGQPRDLAAEQIKAVKSLFADPDVGLWYWNRLIFGFTDTIWDFHGPVSQLVGHWGETHLANGSIIHHTPKGGYEEENIVNSYRRIMVRIPRETFKTSCFTRGAGLRLLALDPERTLGIFNETQVNYLNNQEVSVTVEVPGALAAPPDPTPTPQRRPIS